MPHSNALLISGLLFGSTSLFLSIFIFAIGRQKIHRLWAMFNIVVAWWGFGLVMICLMSKDIERAEFWWKVASVGGLFIPATFFHFVSELTNPKRRFCVPLFYGAAIISDGLYISGFIQHRMSFLYDSFYYVRATDWTYGILAITWVVPAIYGHCLLYRAIKTSEGYKKVQLRYLLLAFSIGFVTGGTSHFFIAYGLTIIHPAWNIFITLYVLICTYAIFQKKILGIELAIRKGLVYALFIGIITGLYFFLLVFLEKMFRESIGYNSTAITIITLAVIIIAAEPLRQILQSAVDHYFFKATLIEMAQERELINQELQKTDRLKAIATLAAGMAHEIKNPLTSIKTFVEYLPQKHDDPEFREKFRRILVDEVDRVNNIVKQLLDFSKPEALQVQIQPLIPIIDETLALLNNNFVKNKIEMIKRYEADPSLRLDRNQMKQVFLNIFLNSIQAMATGGTLTVSVCNGKGGVVMSIQDTGFGIPPENLPHVFDPFFTTKESGTGLGLSIVHGIVKEHGGEIKVSSQAGQGTKVIITFKT